MHHSKMGRLCRSWVILDVIGPGYKPILVRSTPKSGSKFRACCAAVNRRQVPGAAVLRICLERQDLPAPQECAGPRCLNSAAWSFTKSRMLVGASPVSLHMPSVMRS